MLVDRGFQAGAQLPYRLDHIMDIKKLLGSDTKPQSQPDRPPYVYERARSPPRQPSIQPAPNFPLQGSSGPRPSQTPHSQSLPASTPPFNPSEQYLRRQSTPYAIKSELSEPLSGWPRYDGLAAHPPPPPPQQPPLPSQQQRYAYQPYSYDHQAAYYANYSPNKRSSSFDEQAPKRQKKGKGANQKWDAEEDARIIDLRGSGMKWGEIAKKLPGRTEIACRLHYQNYLEKRGEWDEEKKTKLARVYERMKAEIWQPIASEMGVPWRNAEAMHWTLGERDMARRANTTPFSIVSGANSAGPQGEGNGRIAQANRMHDSTIYFEPGDLEERLRGGPADDEGRRLSVDTMNRDYASSDRRASFQSINAPSSGPEYAGVVGAGAVEFGNLTREGNPPRSNGSSRSDQVSPKMPPPSTLTGHNESAPSHYQQHHHHPPPPPPLQQSQRQSTSPSESYRLPPIEHLDHPHPHPPPHQYNQSPLTSSTTTSTTYPQPQAPHHFEAQQQQQQQQEQQRQQQQQPRSPHGTSPHHQHPPHDPSSGHRTSRTNSDGSDRLLALADLSSQQDRKAPAPPSPPTVPLTGANNNTLTVDDSSLRSHRSQASNDDGTGSERSYTIIRKKRARSVENIGDDDNDNRVVEERQ